ncbi:MAG: Rpn family recombination-promoting nuclease/putative transposase [Moorea sp. SIO3A5]|nr:Rpn family recombination-promoting nuclease/putative transposase [Moorena sp. SIO3A5]
MTYYLFPITYYLLPITYYLLPITYYLLPITYSPLPITYYLLPITYYLSPRVSRIYLDELAETPAPSVGIATVQLIVTEEDSAISLAQDLIQRTTEEVDNERQKRELLQLIETILVYKLPLLSRREIEAMFSLSDLRQTKVYQEALAEGIQAGKLEGIQEGRLEGIQAGRLEGKIQGKLESIPRLLALGLTVEQVAQALELEVEQVTKVIQQSSDS